MVLPAHGSRPSNPESHRSRLAQQQSPRRASQSVCSRWPCSNLQLSSAPSTGPTKPSSGSAEGDSGERIARGILPSAARSLSACRWALDPL